MAVIRVQAEDFDLGREVDAVRAGRTDIGAVVTFTGLVRDMGGGQPVSAMELEHYPGMTEAALSQIAAEAEARWPLQALSVIHRYGALNPGDQIVLVVAASPHRAAAFDAASFVMDYLKTRAPFWKKETTPDGARWVDAREEDDAAEARWRDA
ncbi:molybdopterin synthase catalytic subunit MoaE [Pontivivens insulae]|uniref:Molybdopterin synthase catalytic subunit n=1 Tax=Pontivivens insulae TaxID=1639689 RepID=A0A2R8A6H3_9RHOB|nr:molybdopterin synthase catalytic subunit MoaE [Pontivivens insulae]RED17906.1 molybdopterin synthase subunit MoaE [Pontivivens insulae]SPF27796.1 Molybdopterin synthase catalytic subunit [Pontivivens insulae]